MKLFATRLSALLVAAALFAGCATYSGKTESEIYCPLPNDEAAADYELLEESGQYPDFGIWMGDILNYCWPEVAREES